MSLKAALNFLATREFRYYWLPPLLQAATILAFSGDWGSSMNSSPLIRRFLQKFLSSFWVIQIDRYSRLVGHILVYGCLYLLWARAFRHWGSSHGRCLLWSLGLCLAVALADEGHQSMVATRSGALRDVGLDMASALLAAFFAFLSRNIQVVRRKPAG